MIVGVPKEIKVHESRVAITPEGVSEFVAAGHQVIIETGAGLGSAITDQDFTSVGATIVAKASDVWEKAELLLKVKEPIESEYSLLRKNQVLFTYLHLAASKACTDALVASKTTAIAYETVEVNGQLPLLAPMSEVAGRLATQVRYCSAKAPWWPWSLARWCSRCSARQSARDWWWCSRTQRGSHCSGNGRRCNNH